MVITTLNAELAEFAENSNYRFSSVVMSIVTSAPFQMNMKSPQ